MVSSICVCLSFDFHGCLCDLRVIVVWFSFDVRLISARCCCICCMMLYLCMVFVSLPLIAVWLSCMFVLIVCGFCMIFA